MVLVDEATEDRFASNPSFVEAGGGRYRRRGGVGRALVQALVGTMPGVTRRVLAKDSPRVTPSYDQRAPPGSRSAQLAPVEARDCKHESTATGLDSGGLMRTSRDSDLHRCTSVDVLPLYGMQEVWGSNPHSSTPGQKYNSKSRAHGSRAWYSSKVQQQPQRKPSHASSDLASVRMKTTAWPAAV